MNQCWNIVNWTLGNKLQHPPLRVLRAGELDGSPGLLWWRCCHGGGFPLQYVRACFMTHSFLTLGFISYDDVYITNGVYIFIIMVMYSCIFTYECVFYYVLGQRWPNKQVKSLIHFHSRKCIWKCRPENGCHFNNVQAFRLRRMKSHCIWVAGMRSRWPQPNPNYVGPTAGYRGIIQWNLSITTTSTMKSITCDLSSNVF